MGGRALIAAGVTRLPAPIYTRLAQQVVSRLNDGVLVPGLRAQAIPALRDKPDFGDLDVLITHPAQGWSWTAFSRERVLAAFGATHHVQNGPVLSFDTAAPTDPAFPVIGGARFQVDLIFAAPAIFPFALCYYSYNDLGNLLGRVARLAGFKLGHAGLFRPLRDPADASHFVRDILVTRDWGEALDFLGYDPERWGHGFADLEDLFAFVADSPQCHPDVFLLEHNPHRARVRDRKRPTYTAFLAWLAARYPDGEGLTQSERDGRAAAGLAAACARFPAFAMEWKQGLADLAAHRALRARINGRVVQSVTGLTGPALGRYMADLKRQIAEDPLLAERLRTSTTPEIESFLRTRGAPSENTAGPR